MRTVTDEVRHCKQVEHVLKKLVEAKDAGLQWAKVEGFSEGDAVAVRDSLLRIGHRASAGFEGPETNYVKVWV